MMMPLVSDRLLASSSLLPALAISSGVTACLIKQWQLGDSWRPVPGPSEVLSDILVLLPAGCEDDCSDRAWHPAGRPQDES